MAQISAATDKGHGKLEDLIYGGETWTVSPPPAQPPTQPPTQPPA